MKVTGNSVPFRCALAVGLGIPFAVGEIRYRASSLGRLSGDQPINYPTAINNTGQMTGFSRVGSLDVFAFIGDPQTRQYTILPEVPECAGVSVQPLAINELGHVAGAARVGATCQAEAFLWTPEGGITALGDLPGDPLGSSAHAINRWGWVVGDSENGNYSEAFLWTAEDGMIGLGDLPGGCFASGALDINDNNWVVGYGCSSELLGAGFLWTPQDGMVLLDDFLGPQIQYAGAAAINNRGQILGGGYIVNRWDGYLWDPDIGITVVPYPFEIQGPLESISPLSLSEAGHVVGRVVRIEDDEFHYLGFVWEALRGTRLLRDVLDPCNSAEYQWLKDPISVNSSGWIVANAGSVFEPGALLIPYIPGDLDENELCDLQDLAILLSNFSRTADAAYEHGDLDCDQDVDLQDLAILLSNFGESLP